MKLLFKNARIATDADVRTGDLLVDGETISRIGADIPPDGAKVIDATGKYLLPGGVDVHTHFDLDTGSAHVSDDFYTGCVAAACGGTTTIVDHLGFGPPGCGLLHQVDVYHALAERSVVDYGFHGVVQHVDDAVLDDMAKLPEAGVTSLKAYLTYNYRVDDAALLPLLSRARELGMLVCAHCENDAIIRFLTKRLRGEGWGAPRYHAVSRPPACEAEAVWRMLMLAKAAGDAPVYIVHLSSGLGLEAIRTARNNRQTNVFAETCPQYLLLNEDRYADDREGLKYIISPPLRPAADNAALWSGLVHGDIDVVATDHCPFSFDPHKLAGLGDFTRCPNGAPGVETRLSLMLSAGFMKGRLTLPDVVRLCCTRPAQLFGLHPRKGVLAPGSDADLVLFDPAVEKTITGGDLHERVDYTPYEGISVRGAPALTVSRGEIVCENGVFAGKAGRGRYLHRQVVFGKD